MPEQNEQQNSYQSTNYTNWWSDLIKEDGETLNWNLNNDWNKEKKWFDLLWSSYEDSIWNTNLDWNEKGKSIPKSYPWKKRRHARAIVLIFDIVLWMLWFLTYWLEILSTILMVVFLILWITTIRTPENQEIIKEKNIGKRLKRIIRLYAILTAIYVINDIYLVMNIEYTIDDVYSYTEWHLSSFDLTFYNNNKTIINEEVIKVANEYAWCNCFWDNATQNTKTYFNSAEFVNIINKLNLNYAIEAFLYKLKQDSQYWKIIENHEKEIRTELTNSANKALWRECFWSYEKACDLSNEDMEDLWTKTYNDAIDTIAPKIENWIWK